MRLLSLATLCVCLAACGDDSQSGPGGVPPGDAKALDEAAEMVERGRPELPVEETNSTPAEDSKNESGAE